MARKSLNLGINNNLEKQDKMNLESPVVNLNKSAQYIFDALCDVKNYEKLMPENISKFEVTDEDSFIFGLSFIRSLISGIPDKPNIKEFSSVTSNFEIFSGINFS